jgi:hypothetical protein
MYHHKVLRCNRWCVLVGIFVLSQTAETAGCSVMMIFAEQHCIDALNVACILSTLYIIVHACMPCHSVVFVTVLHAMHQR